MSTVLRSLMVGDRRQRSPSQGKRGFTLVELMIVVAIIGVLAALAIYGTRRYLAASKASEAKHSIGEISRNAHAKFEAETRLSENLGEGVESVTAAHVLCDSATPVPAAVPAGKKYQPKTASGSDWQMGNDDVGWECLRFSIYHPIYYQYHYYNGKSVVGVGSPLACSADCYEAGALGDLDGNSVLGRFARTGVVNKDTGELRASTYIYVENEAE